MKVLVPLEVSVRMLAVFAPTNWVSESSCTPTSPTELTFSEPK